VLATVVVATKSEPQAPKRQVARQRTRLKVSDQDRLVARYEPAGGLCQDEQRRSLSHRGSQAAALRSAGLPGVAILMHVTQASGSADFDQRFYRRCTVSIPKDLSAKLQHQPGFAGPK